MRLLLNNTQEAIALDIGHIVPASGQLEISDANVLLFQRSDDMWAKLATGDLSYSDGVSTLALSDAINHLKNFYQKYTLDTDNAILSRTKITKTGWGLVCHTIGIETSTLGSLHDVGEAGSDYGFGTLKFYDDEDTELTEQSAIDTDCVKTVLEWEPTNTYEVIGGEMYNGAKIDTPFYVWFKHPYSGHEFCTGGFDMSFLPAYGKKTMDGRAPKELPYYPGAGITKVRLTARHNAGVKQKLQLVLELYEE